MSIAERLRLSRSWATTLLYNAVWCERWQDRRNDESWREMDDRAHASLRAEFMEYGDDPIEVCEELPGSVTMLNAINIRRALESATVTIQQN